MLDFVIAKMNHQLWKRKLHKYIIEDQPIDENELVSEHECNLGKWLYSDGLERYREMMEINQLERIHKELHALTYSIVLDKKKNKMEEAKAGLERLGEISDEIVALLDKLELKIK